MDYIKKMSCSFGISTNCAKLEQAIFIHNNTNDTNKKSYT